ncbi:MAG: epoxyqueuosine reductase QueH [Nitrospinae bacterium]|nr:epoxyqueuosine reductase QueH [Nitrospinota bacterium]
MAGEKPGLLLHLCCAPCVPYVVETLREEYEVTLYFYNPNIHPETEYMARLTEVRHLARLYRLPLVEDEYVSAKWFNAVKGLENEPERGARCSVCFEKRLEKAAETAARMKLECFGTVLSVSPHKDAAVINRIGAKTGETHDVSFLEADWKKKEGFKKTVEIGKNLGLHRQDYCGCIFSLKSAIERKQNSSSHQNNG